MNGLPWTIPGGQQVQFTPYQIAGRGGGSAVVTGNGQLQSQGFQAGSTGWCIYGDGSCEFNDGTFRGAITGSTIDIGTGAASFHVDINGNMWIGAAAYAATVPFRVENTGDLHVGGDDATSFHVDSGGGIWSGASVANKATAPFRVTNAGALYASSGTFATGTYTGTGTVSNSSSNTFQSGNFVSGTSGWQIKGDGNAEFKNMTLRGSLSTGGTGSTIEILESSNIGYLILAHGGAVSSADAFLSAQYSTSPAYGLLVISGPDQHAAGLPPTITLMHYNDNSIRAIGFHDTTSVNIYSGYLAVADGTEGDPTYTFGNDANTGLYYSTNALNITVANDTRAKFSSTQIDLYPDGDANGTVTLDASGGVVTTTGGYWRGTDGSAGAPTFSWSGDTNTGMYHTANADEIAIACGGTESFRFTRVSSEDYFVVGAMPTSASGANVFYDTSTGHVRRSTSSREFKQDIEPVRTRPTVFDQIAARRFKWDPKIQGADHREWSLGFVIEELAELAPELVDWTRHEDGTLEPINIDLRAIVALLVDEVQQLKVGRP